MRNLSTRTLRPLHIRFDAYGAGDDKEFKYELMVLMTGSIGELKSAAQNAFSQGETDRLKKAVHKAKSTLMLINDPELLQVVDDLSGTISTGNGSDGHKREVLSRFNQVCDSIVESLEHESISLRQGF